jgi:[ribosomal protein S18]-alanine N-acetyltransferase
VEVELRAACPGDLSRCLELETGSFDDDPYNLATLRQFLDVSGELFTVAVDPSNIVGYILAAPSIRERQFWLLSIAVDPPYRCLGIGRRLLVHALETCRSLGASHVRCTVRPDNSSSLSMLRPFDFTEIGEDPDYFGRGKARKVLELALV